MSLKRRERTIHPEDASDFCRDEDEEVRFYYDPADPSIPPMPSVTSILQVRDDPEKDKNLQDWRDNCHGQKDWAQPWWKDQMTYKGLRGTLVHYAILSQLGDPDGDTYFHEVGDSQRGYEEYWAEYALKKWSKKAPSANAKDIPYSPTQNRYDGEHAWDAAMRDCSWAITRFKEEWERRGLTDENIIAVEKHVRDTDYGYAGQLDLLYEDDGEVVCADLKTSSAIRLSAKLQLAAYAYAVGGEVGASSSEEATTETDSDGISEVDRIEVWWAYPDDKAFAVEDQRDWDRSWRGLEHEWLSLVARAHETAYVHTLDVDDEDFFN